MEEDIKVLEEFIRNYKEVQEKYKDDEIQAEIERSCYFEEVPAKAIENLIKRNKQLEEGNKKWEEVYDEDQEHITNLNNKIFDLENKNKKLDKENQGLFELYNFNDTNLFAKTLKEYRKEILNSIPKSKIRETIKELEGQEIWYIQNKGLDELYGRIDMLKELLEEE